MLDNLADDITVVSMRIKSRGAKAESCRPHPARRGFAVALIMAIGQREN